MLPVGKRETVKEGRPFETSELVDDAPMHRSFVPKRPPDRVRVFFVASPDQGVCS